MSAASASPPDPSVRPPDSPTTFDPQTGMHVHSGFTAPHPRPAAPERESLHPTASPELWVDAQAAPAAQYARTDYGSDEYEWEPTYSDAPGYADEEDDDGRGPAKPPVRPEQAYMYETPEWERPQFDPPRLDSGRHPGWSSGFGETARSEDTDLVPDGRTGSRTRRSIPRAE